MRKWALHNHLNVYFIQGLINLNVPFVKLIDYRNCGANFFPSERLQDYFKNSPPSTFAILKLVIWQI